MRRSCDQSGRNLGVGKRIDVQFRVRGGVQQLHNVFVDLELSLGLLIQNLLAIRRVKLLLRILKLLICLSDVLNSLSVGVRIFFIA